MELVEKYFSELTEIQRNQLGRLPELYKEWNEKINVISRKDIDNFEIHHLLHSLSIAKFVKFKPGTICLDLGTGGGLPGIPLSIIFPEATFKLVDGTAKKINVANAIIEEIGLTNCTAHHQRAEEMKEKFDFVLARAVTRLSNLLPIARPLIKKEMRNAIPNGLITLKGGDLKEELGEVKGYKEKVEIFGYFPEPYFKEKYVLYLPVM